MKIRVMVPVLAALLMTPAVWAQSSSAAAQAPTKVGVINIQAAIASTAEGKQSLAVLQSKFAPQAADLQSMQKQIQDLQNRLQAGQTTLSDEEKARLQRQGEQLARTLQRKQQEFQDDTNDAQQEVVNTIGSKLVGVLEKYSRDNGYSIILDTSAQATPVLFAANQVDVTQDIIRLYDQANPVKTAGGAAPPAPRPAPRTPGAATAPAPKP